MQFHAVGAVALHQLVGGQHMGDRLINRALVDARWQAAQGDADRMAGNYRVGALGEDLLLARHQALVDFTRQGRQIAAGHLFRQQVDAYRVQHAAIGGLRLRVGGGFLEAGDDGARLGAQGFQVA